MAYFGTLFPEWKCWQTEPSLDVNCVSSPGNEYHFNIGDHLLAAKQLKLPAHGEEKVISSTFSRISDLLVAKIVWKWKWTYGVEKKLSHPRFSQCANFNCQGVCERCRGEGSEAGSLPPHHHRFLSFYSFLYFWTSSQVLIFLFFFFSIDRSKHHHK